MSTNTKTRTMTAKSTKSVENTVAKRLKHIPGITITGNSALDQAIIDEYGTMELYLVHKVIAQFDEIALYKRQLIDLKKELRAAKLTINKYHREAMANRSAPMEKCNRQYVYMIRPREFIRLNENTYKIGKTTQNPNSRLAGYPKGSEVLSFICVNDCDSAEKEIMSKFISEFKQALDYGREYFTGNEEAMLAQFITICTSNQQAILEVKTFHEEKVCLQK